MVEVAIIGYLAGILTTWSFLPQVIKVVKTKQTKDISLAMYIMMTTGVALWLTYGFLLNDKPIIMANLITIVLAFIVLVYKILNK